ncbi:hypothetical protein EBZ37_11435, partial [bacterium]|nr:hypothetical protein [bacterium]
MNRRSKKCEGRSSSNESPLPPGEPRPKRPFGTIGGLLLSLILGSDAAASTSYKSVSQWDFAAFAPLFEGLSRGVDESSWCVRGDGVPCENYELASPAYRQVFILPTGYTESEYRNFRTDFDRFVQSVRDLPTEV